MNCKILNVIVSDIVEIDFNKAEGKVTCIITDRSWKRFVFKYCKLRMFAS